MKKERSVANRIFWISLCVLLSIYALSIIFTLLWGFVSSLKNQQEFLFDGTTWLKFPTLDAAVKWNSRNEFFKLANYQRILQDYHLVEEQCTTDFIASNGMEVTHRASGGFAMVMVNTAVYTVVGSVLHTVIPAVVAYAVAKYSNVVGKIIMGAALFAMTTPIIGSQASMLTMLRNLGVYDTFWGYLLMKASFAGMYFFVFTAFYESLPDSYAEAAEIDGASQFSVLVKIILPLSVKTLSTVFVIQFIHFWNDYQTAYIYMPSHPTLAYAVWWLTASNAVGGGDMVVRVAASMSLALPILIAFICFKDKLMGNVSLGGLKQ